MKGTSIYITDAHHYKVYFSFKLSLVSYPNSTLSQVLACTWIYQRKTKLSVYEHKLHIS